jgi:hypothetical protein
MNTEGLAVFTVCFALRAHNVNLCRYALISGHVKQLYMVE